MYFKFNAFLKDFWDVYSVDFIVKKHCCKCEHSYVTVYRSMNGFLDQ